MRSTRIILSFDIVLVVGALFLALSLFAGMSWGALQDHRRLTAQLLNERDSVLELFHGKIISEPWPEEQALDAVRCYESSCDKTKGLNALGSAGRKDPTASVCERPAGPYQVKPATIVWMVNKGWLDAPTTCKEAKEWAMNEVNGRGAARIYIRHLIALMGSPAKALCAYQHGPEAGLEWCARAKNVLGRVGE